MKGSISYYEDRGQWIVSWYDGGKVWKITRYKGELMYHRKIAEKCLAMVQADYENYLAGLGAFRLEKYTGKGWTDVIEFFEEWLETKQKKKPATYKGYRSYFVNWIQPFFAETPVMLHEIQLNTLDRLLEFIRLSPKGKYNVMNCFHAFMDYAWRSKRIPEMPPFPKKSDFGLVEPTIRWLPEERQMKIIHAIPEIHRPIFLWLKYHLRRPSEACALHKEDYDPFNSVFVIRRSISARKLVDSTKTNIEHLIPCHSAFEPHVIKLMKEPGRLFFTNPRARRKNKRYTNESLNRLWKAACKAVSEDIDLYSGLKHSSCSQYVNEKGLSISDLQTITDHARIESVRRYAKVEVARRKQLMELGRVIDFHKTSTSEK
jgi:integrase